MTLTLTLFVFFDNYIDTVTDFVRLFDNDTDTDIGHFFDTYFNIVCLFNTDIDTVTDIVCLFDNNTDTDIVRFFH